MRAFLCLTLVLVFSGCRDKARCKPTCTTPDDSGSDARATDADTADGGRDAGSPDAASDADIDAGTVFTELSEQEPNDGNPIEEVNQLRDNVRINGTITDGDADWFFFESTPGKIYRLTWVETATDWSRQFSILDAGRGDEGPGQDYTKVLKQADFESVEFFAFGEGGHYIAVSSQDGGTGSYSFTLAEVTPNDASGETISFPSTINASLSSPGAIAIHPFEASEGTDIEIRLDAAELPQPSDIDSRIYVYSSETGSWIMRNDDDGTTVDSRVSALLPKGGSLWLVVENIALDQAITKLDYRLTASLNP